MAMLFLESTVTDPFYNLALEQYVFDCLPRSNEYLMLWQNDNAIIIGKHQNTLEEISPAVVREKNIRVVRRLSGGGAVYHDLGNLNYTFIRDAGSLSHLDLQAFCIPVIHALAHLGIEAQLSGRNDMTIQGQKFSGNAQYLRDGRVMHHGTLLFDSDLSVLSQALKVSADKVASKGIKSVRSRVTNIRPHLGEDLSTAQFCQVIRRFLVAETGAQPYLLTEQDQAAIQKLRQERYATWQWNYGASPPYTLHKERRVEGCGNLRLYLEVRQGRIAGFATRGDYFGDDAAPVEQALLGVEANAPSLRAALAELDVERYYKGLTVSQLIDLILE